MFKYKGFLPSSLPFSECTKCVYCKDCLFASRNKDNLEKTMICRLRSFPKQAEINPMSTQQELLEICLCCCANSNKIMLVVMRPNEESKDRSIVHVCGRHAMLLPTCNERIINVQHYVKTS